MPAAEIITIGTELLLGEIVDTNSQYLAQTLRDAGIDIFRFTTVGDNANRIAHAINESLERCDIIITTGGLGPTVDDPTRDAVANALGVKPIFHPELWEQIKTRFQRLGRIPTDNNRRQAYIPEGAVAIENPVGTAPIFVMERQAQVIIALPGVPSEMKHLMEHSIIPYLHQFYNIHSMIKTRVLHTVGVGESQIDDLIGDLEQLSNPSVGLAAHTGQVDVRITAKATTEAEAFDLITPIENTLRNRLGDWIYGADRETLEEIALNSIRLNHWKLVTLETGMGGNLIRRLVKVGEPYIGGQVLTELPHADRLLELTEEYRRLKNADVGLGVTIQPNGNFSEVIQILITPRETNQVRKRYGGPPEYAPLWAFNQSMDLIRRMPHDS